MNQNVVKETINRDRVFGFLISKIKIPNAISMSMERRSNLQKVAILIAHWHSITLQWEWICVAIKFWWMHIPFHLVSVALYDSNLNKFNIFISFVRCHRTYINLLRQKRDSKPRAGRHVLHAIRLCVPVCPIREYIERYRFKTNI